MRDSPSENAPPVFSSTRPAIRLHQPREERRECDERSAQFAEGTEESGGRAGGI